MSIKQDARQPNSGEINRGRRGTLQWGLGISVAALVGGGRRARAAAPAPVTVRIGYQKWGLLVFIKAKGLLEKALAAQNAKVEWAEFPAGPQLIEGISAGKQDFGVVGEGPPIFGQAAGAPLVYLGAEPSAPGAEAIVVAKGSPIKTVAELKGKQVVLNKGSNVHYFLIRALEEAKVAYEDVKISFVPPAGARAAFESGKVDAWAIWDPFLASVQTATGARILRDAKGLAQNPGYYVGTRAFADANPQLVKVLLDEIRKAGLYANGHGSEIAEFLAPQLGIEKTALALALGRNPFGAGPVTPEHVAAQQQIADTYFRQKLIPKSIRVADAQWSPPLGAIKSAQR
jgi:sulfonate transport system substrate-binding protein